jgi:hypothetical protein
MGNKIHPDCLGTHYLPCQIAELKSQLQAEKERAEAYREIAVADAQMNCSQECFDASDGCAYQLASAVDDKAQRILAEKKK